MSLFGFVGLLYGIDYVYPETVAKVPFAEYTLTFINSCWYWVESLFFPGSGPEVDPSPVVEHLVRRAPSTFPIIDTTEPLTTRWNSTFSSYNGRSLTPR